MLAGLFHHYGYVPTQPQTHERLDLDPEEQRLRELAHHRDGTSKQMGGGADPHKAYGRNRRTRIGRPLEIQRGQGGERFG